MLFDAACGVAYECVFYLFFFLSLWENMTQNHRFQFPSKAAVTNVIWLTGQVQIHNWMNKHTIWMKRVVSFIISISGINECGARTAGDLGRRKVNGLWLQAAVLLLFYFLWVNCPLEETGSTEETESMQMRHRLHMCRSNTGLSIQNTSGKHYNKLRSRN